MNELICVYIGCLFSGFLIGIIYELDIRLYIMLLIILQIAGIAICSGDMDFNLSHCYNASNWNWAGFISTSMSGYFIGILNTKLLLREHKVRKLVKAWKGNRE